MNTQKIAELSATEIGQYLKDNPNIWALDSYRKSLTALKETESVLIFYDEENILSNHTKQISQDKILLEAASRLHKEITEIHGSSILIRAFLAKMPPRSSIAPHKDPLEFKETKRYHWVICTNKDCEMRVERKKFHFAVNEIWFFENQKIHSAINGGESARIHFIIDLK